MIDTKKLLYIFPDVAYIAEGLPGKKAHTFSIHSFTQINGNFLNEDKFIAENIQKLFGKLESGETYHIILPDFLFTSTIISIHEKSEAQIKEYLQATTFPQMGISKDSHLIESVVLNEIRGTSRVQLSAIEKELLAPIRVATDEHSVAIAGISPLSWAIKSLISLEPSISVLQLGSNLYACEHYIGVDQSSYASIDDVSSIAETIKTLKGSEPSIQTVYLLSNQLVEETLKDELNKTVPIQQMADDSDAEERMPASVKEVLEYSFKTLSIPDYPVPVFAVTKPSADELSSFGVAAAAATSDDDDDLADAELPKPAAPKSTKTEKTEDQSAKADVAAEQSTSTQEEEPSESEGPDADTTSDDEAESETSNTQEDSTPSILPAAGSAAILGAPGAATVMSPTAAAATAGKPDQDTTDYDEVSSVSAAAEVPESEEADADELPPPAKADTKVTTEESKDTPPTRLTSASESSKDEEDIDLRQFVGAQSEVTEKQAEAEKPKPTAVQPLPTIKNKSGVTNMLKMIFITLAVFCVTVAVGVGVGLAILKYSGSENGTDTPTVEVESTPTPAPEATPEPTPEASESAELAPTNLKILVVNATTKAGYAGTFKTKIEDSELGKVTAANAKGEYDDGFLVYMEDRNNAAIAKLEDATDLETTFDEAVADEDPQGTYDLILVLAE